MSVDKPTKPPSSGETTLPSDPVPSRFRVTARRVLYPALAVIASFVVVAVAAPGRMGSVLDALSSGRRWRPRVVLLPHRERLRRICPVDGDLPDGQDRPRPRRREREFGLLDWFSMLSGPPARRHVVAHRAGLESRSIPHGGPGRGHVRPGTARLPRRRPLVISGRASRRPGGSHGVGGAAYRMRHGCLHLTTYRAHGGHLPLLGVRLAGGEVGGQVR